MRRLHLPCLPCLPHPDARPLTPCKPTISLQQQRAMITISSSSSCCIMSGRRTLNQGCKLLHILFKHPHQPQLPPLQPHSLPVLQLTSQSPCTQRLEVEAEWMEQQRLAGRSSWHQCGRRLSISRTQHPPLITRASAVCSSKRLIRHREFLSILAPRLHPSCQTREQPLLLTMTHMPPT